MKHIIRLDSRGGENNYLKHIKDNIYKLYTHYDTIRCGKIGNDNFVDPSGGPMIIEKRKLREANAIVKNIDFNKGIFITLE